MDVSKGSFTVFDYVIFISMLVLSTFIGVYYHFSDRKKSPKEYFLTNRNMPVATVSFSLMASFLSATSFLGVPAENYLYGTQYIMMNLGYAFGTPVAAFIFLPVFYKIQGVSVFEYLEKRFGRGVRLLACSVFILQMMLYMAIILYAPALALNVMTGLSKWSSVYLIGFVCTFYSTLGGMRAVLWTDLFQSLIMLSAAFVVCIKGTLDVGGLSEVLRIAEEGQRIQFFDFDPDPTVRHTFWTLVVGGFFSYFPVYVNQVQIQRLLTVRSLKESQIAVFCCLFLQTVLVILLCFAGIVIYANLSACDPILRSEETNIHKADQIVPYFVMTSLTRFPGLPGLFVAGVFSASLSSVSSAINSLTAVTVEDFLHPLYFHKLSEKRVTIFTKITALSYGILCIFLTFIVDQGGGILTFVIMLFNVTGGPSLGLFCLGMLFRKTTSKGVMIGYISSICFSLTVGTMGMMKVQKPPSYHLSTDACPGNNFSLILNNSTPGYLDQITYENWNISSQNSTQNHEEYVFPLLKLSYMWYAGMGFFTCFVIGLFASAICGKKEYVSSTLLSPVTRFWITEKDHIPEIIQMTQSS
ncbi:putative sodium-dependent multivitamin transporter [Trichonephila clavata]|uniref:Putative sodium-dependent multivitamin transporter n=1 Tax=Trichonephila clavata TaxID=2740835 RepID=A0A8X6I1I7_TRICU|nr:putative sodium-dependent multivitamin transporter [Trichonephila clavata]